MRTFEDYAKVDLAIGDNDPVYFAVCKARQEWGHPWAVRFCVGMLTYYHMGTAVQAADYQGHEFWEFLRSKFLTAPRGAARRHFRAANGESGFAGLMRYAPNPETFFDRMKPTYYDVKHMCSFLPQFGPYMVLKICDYMDRCLGTPITSWAGLGRNLSKEPIQALEVLYPTLPAHQAFALACDRIAVLELLASPSYDRPAGPAEVETILCDWSHVRKGTNWPGADLIVKREALRGYGGKAAQMAEWLPPLVPRDLFKCELL